MRIELISARWQRAVVPINYNRLLGSQKRWVPRTSHGDPRQIRTVNNLLKGEVQYHYAMESFVRPDGIEPS